MIRAVLLLLPALAWAAVSPGIEGRLVAELPAGLSALSDPQAPLMLRIAVREALADGRCRYDLRYIGNEPGKRDLLDCLRDGSGRRPAGLLTVEIASLLPAGQAALSDPPPEATAPLGGWKPWLLALAGIWILAVLIVLRPRRRSAAATVAPLPTLVELLTPLVEAAASGSLDVPGQARLERLLLAFWRERLALDRLEPAAALARLRAHPEAGALLRGTDAWLHQPPGRAAVDVATLLAPYRHGAA
jgi:hypothetical protein